MLTFLSSVKVANKGSLAGLTSSRTRTSATVAPYVSAFRPLQLGANLESDSITVPSAKLEYITYRFKRTTFETDQQGQISEIHNGGIIEHIEISKDWQRYIEGGQPKGGYISKGLMKFAFHVRSLFYPLILKIADLGASGSYWKHSICHIPMQAQIRNLHPESK